MNRYGAAQANFRKLPDQDMSDDNKTGYGVFDHIPSRVVLREEAFASTPASEFGGDEMDPNDNGGVSINDGDVVYDTDIVGRDIYADDKGESDSSVDAGGQAPMVNVEANVFSLQDTGLPEDDDDLVEPGDIERAPPARTRTNSDATQFQNPSSVMLPPTTKSVPRRPTNQRPAAASRNAPVRPNSTSTPNKPGPFKRLVRAFQNATPFVAGTGVATQVSDRPRFGNIARDMSDTPTSSQPGFSAVAPVAPPSSAPAQLALVAPTQSGGNWPWLVGAAVLVVGALAYCSKPVEKQQQPAPTQPIRPNPGGKSRKRGKSRR